jgi:hypothetical protein
MWRAPTNRLLTAETELMSVSAQPVVFFAFANDRLAGTRYLRNLPEEQRRVRKAMAAGRCEVVERGNVTLDEVVDVLQDSRYRDRMAIFHYGGHAGGRQLVLDRSPSSSAATNERPTAPSSSACKARPCPDSSGSTRAPSRCAWPRP